MSSPGALDAGMDELDRWALYRAVLFERFHAPRLGPPPSYPEPARIVDERDDRVAADLSAARRRLAPVRPGSRAG